MVALCGNGDDNNSDVVQEALERNGYETLAFEIGGDA